MKNSTLTHARLLEVLRYEPETGLLYWRVNKATYLCAGKVAGGMNWHGYIGIKVDGVNYLAHRLAWFYVTGAWPIEIDHKDLDRSNNRWNNLREVTRKQNMENKVLKKTNTSGCTGVVWHKRNWQVQITHNYERIHLGTFNDLEEAKAARLAAERKYFTHSPRVEA